MSATVSARNDGSMEVALAFIKPSPLNPRKTFAEGPLQELADSIREHGVLEPLVLRSVNGQYEIIAGERRFRAARLAGLKSVPAVIRNGVDDATHLKLALVENLQRADLDPIEEAEGLKRLASMGMKQTEIAAAVNKSAPAVSNSLRLLDLPDDVRTLIQSGELTAAHGKALAGMACNNHIQSKLAEIAIRDGWNSKDLEKVWSRNWLPSELNEFYFTLNYNTLFDRTECKGSCPHNAYRAGGMYEGYCLLPACYEAKTRAARDAARAKEEKDRERALAKAQAKIEGQSGEDPAPMKLADLTGVPYESFEWQKPPSACRVACEKRTQAQPRHRDDLITVCLDPQCCRKMRRQDTMAQGKADKLRHQQLLTLTAEKTERMLAISSRTLAVLVAEALAHRSSAAIRDACDHHRCLGHEKAFVNAYMTRQEQLDKLATLDPVDMAKVAIEAILRDQLHNRYKLKNCGTVPTTEWYLETDRPTAPAPSQDAVPEVQADFLGPRCPNPVAYAVRWKSHDGRTGTLFSCLEHGDRAQEDARQLGDTVEVEILDSSTVGKLSCSCAPAALPGGES